MEIRQTFLAPAIEMVGILTNESIPGPAKLERLTDKLVEIIESADDLVALAPGIGVALKIIVDNPFADKWERDNLAKPGAEAIYQFYKGATQGLDSLDPRARAVVLPVQALISDLFTRSDLSGEQKRETLAAEWNRILDAAVSGALDLVGGFKPLVQALLTIGPVQEARRAATQFLAELSYQVYVTLFGKPA